MGATHLGASGTPCGARWSAGSICPAAPGLTAGAQGVRGAVAGLRGGRGPARRALASSAPRARARSAARAVGALLSGTRRRAARRGRSHWKIWRLQGSCARTRRGAPLAPAESPRRRPGPALARGPAATWHRAALGRSGRSLARSHRRRHPRAPKNRAPAIAIAQSRLASARPVGRGRARESPPAPEKRRGGAGEGDARRGARASPPRRPRGCRSVSVPPAADRARRPPGSRATRRPRRRAPPAPSGAQSAPGAPVPRSLVAAAASSRRLAAIATSFAVRSSPATARREFPFRSRQDCAETVTHDASATGGHLWGGRSSTGARKNA